MKTALVLGGGGARGLAHIGVLKVLEQEGIRPDLIIGCSIGAIIGGMYAQNPQIEIVEERVRKFFESQEYLDLGVDILEKNRDRVDEDDFIRQIARNIMKRVLLNMVASRQSILKDDKLGSAINYLIDPGNITDTTIPFACNATDLVTGRSVLFTEGDIRLAIKASSTIPGYLPPVEYDSQILVDGAVTYTVPTKFAHILGADFIISVDVKQRLKPENDFRNVFDILLRANTVTSYVLSDEIPDFSDVKIRPSVYDYMWYDFRQLDDIIRAGEAAARKQLQLIKRKWSKAKRRSFWYRLFHWS